ncbi:MAG: Ubiquinone [Gemmataceae bacterium]|nr:Ubiquinone [Gemmataceae bacterium]
MDTPGEARDYDAMDHSAVNHLFAAEFLAVWNRKSPVLDVGTGTAQIPIELCRQHPAPDLSLVVIDLADHMLALARTNVARAGLTDRISVEKADAKRFPHATAAFGAVISNSIIHHIPDPSVCLAEMHRVCAPGGVLFVRDLLRPVDEPTLRHQVDTYAAGANAHQRQMFADSLRAALTLAEIRELLARLGYAPDTVKQSSDRHWTWSAERRG